MAFYKALWSQHFPPVPTFTEKELQSQVGKVFIVTGSNQGIGYELVRMLYPTGATIYLACRSEERANNAIKEITSISSKPTTPATLKYLHLDLNDLTTIKASAAKFRSQETKLDILWNNAGIGGNPIGGTTAQSLEAHIGINCVAPLLFTQELLSLLKAAAESNKTARVVWASSLMSEALSSAGGGQDYKLMENDKTTAPLTDYANSKVGNYFFAVEMARRYGGDGIISVAQNPGNLRTNIFSDMPWLAMLFIKYILYEVKFGAYTLLYSGFSTDITSENNGAYIRPFGYVAEHARKDVRQAVREGKPKEFWEWCEGKYRPYV